MKKNIPQVKAKYSYHLEDDVLSLAPVKRVYDSSIQVGNLIFDLDKEKHIIGIEILSASLLFNCPKEALRKLRRVQGEIEVGEEYLKVRLRITSYLRNSERTNTINLERVKPEFLQPTQLGMTVA